MVDALRPIKVTFQKTIRGEVTIMAGNDAYAVQQALLLFTEQGIEGLKLQDMVLHEDAG